MANTISGPGGLSGSGTIKTEIIYNIGDTGPGGGVIFYDAGSTLSWGRYIEVANRGWSDLNPTNDPFIQFSGNVSQYFGGSYNTIGTGKTNFDLAIAQNSTPNKAITIVNDYRGGGKSDWFIGNVTEMLEFRAARNSLPYGYCVVDGGPPYYESATYSFYTSLEAYQANLVYAIANYYPNYGESYAPVYKFNTSAAPRPMRYV